MRRERKANRMYGYDYSADALYFVTSCVKDRICCLGEISDGQMVLNPLGTIAQKQWIWLGKQYAYVILHAFVVMHSMPDQTTYMVSLRLIGIMYGQVATCPYKGRIPKLNRCPN